MTDRKKLDLAKVGKLKPHPIFNGLPDTLKDPSCYVRIERRLQEAMFSDHKHAKILAFDRCKRCRAKRDRRHELMKEEGFQSIEQYLEWRRIMSIIIGQQDIQLT